MAVSSEVKLAIYNGALRHLGSRNLSSLTENREPRRVLDDIWGSSNDMVKLALTRGEWNFGLRTMVLDYNPSIEPDFGFQRAFDKPTDYARLAGLSADEYFRTPLTNSQYVEEAAFWFSDHDAIYIRYVSTDTAYGMDSAKWSEPFKKYLEYYMAYEGCERITNSTTKEDRLYRKMTDALKVAKSNDAMAEGVKFLPSGSWVRSRYSQIDRGLK